MALSSFDARLKKALEQRQMALARMRTRGSEAKDEITCEVKDVTETQKAKFAGTLQEINPQKLIRENPWYAVLGALGAGLVAVPILSRWMQPPTSTAIVNGQAPGEAQRVVIEVVGAGTVQGQAAKPATGLAAWKPIIDALMPILTMFGGMAGQQVAQEKADEKADEKSEKNGNGTSVPDPVFIPQEYVPPEGTPHAGFHN